MIAIRYRYGGYGNKISTNLILALSSPFDFVEVKSQAHFWLEIMKIFYLLITILIYTSISVQSDVPLPDTISPQMYNIVLSVSSNLATRRFTGSVLLTFKTLESVNEIWLNSRGHSQMAATVHDAMDNQVANTTVTRESDDVVRFSLTSQLTANETYQMLLSYTGNLLITPDGFFRSSYFLNENGIERFM